MDLKEIGINTGNWVDLAQDRDYWRALVNENKKKRRSEFGVHGGELSEGHGGAEVTIRRSTWWQILPGQFLFVWLSLSVGTVLMLPLNCTSSTTEVHTGAHPHLIFMALQAIDDQGLLASNLLARRGERSSSQFRGNVWQARRQQLFASG